MFIILLKYLKPLEEMTALRAPHLEHLEAYYQDGTVLTSGRQNPATGGLIIAKGSRAKIEKMVADDPFNTGGAADFEIIEFDPMKINEAFTF
ncbi:MAG: YciI family protein [Alphaproteobacteria bacterium]